MTSSAPTTIRQRLDALKPQVLAVATRHGASNLRIYGSIATGREHAASDLDLLVDLSAEQSLLGLNQSSPRPGGSAGLFSGRDGSPAPPDTCRDPGASPGPVKKDRLYLESIRDGLERIAEYTAAGEGF
jgi:hypothetical protein